MNDPWQILMLDASTASPKDVEEACARLVQQHEPETDPEGARRVREAHDRALAEIHERDAGGEPESDAAPEAHEGDAGDHGVATARAVAPSAVTLPESVRVSFGELESAAASGNAEQLEAALQTFEEHCEAAQVDGATRASALEQACAKSVNLLADVVPDPSLVRLVEQGQVNLPNLVLSAWVEKGRRERIVQFGGALLAQAKSLATPECSAIMARVGVLAGLENPALASSLGSLAGPQLPEEVRPQIMGQLEHEVALGAAFEDVKAEMRPFWFERLRHATEPHDWQDADSQRALNDLIEGSRYTWRGWGIVKQILPSELWEQVEDRLRQQAQQLTESAPVASKFPGWIMIPVVVVVLIALRYLGSDEPDASPPSPDLPPVPASSGNIPPSQEDNDRKHQLWDTLQTSSSGTVRKSGTASVAPPRAPEPPAALKPPPAPPAPVAVATPPPEAKPSEAKPTLPDSPVDEKKKAHDAYLRALRNGSLFDGSIRPRRQP